MKICAIGDIHGRDYWRYIPYQDFDKVIFLGDYCDSFDKSNEDILKSLRDVIKLKNSNMDKFILLLGNHDLQYLFSPQKHKCSGYRESMYIELHDLFRSNQDLFKPIHVIDNYIFSHAGICTPWLNKIVAVTGSQINSDFSNLESIITRLFNARHDVLFEVGRSRGGMSRVGGIFWADLMDLNAFMLTNANQICGHNPVNKIFTHKALSMNSTITYCDDIYGYYELEIKEK